MIFEAMAAMYHATRAQVQKAGIEELKPFPREVLIMYAVRILVPFKLTIRIESP